MKKIDLGQSIGILANLGVIAGIVFLGFEINQSNQLARAQTRNDVSASIGSLLQNMVSHPELIELRMRAIEEPDTLNDLERERIFIQMALRMRIWENIHYQYRQKLFDEREFAVEREVWRLDVNGEPLFLGFYCQTREQFSEAFILEIESLMQSTDC